MKKTTTAAVTRALLAAAIVLITLNTWMAVQSLQQIMQSQYWVAHSWQVLYRMQSIISLLKDAESSTRDFLITGTDISLVPYSNGQQQLPGELTELRKLTIDNPAQQQRITELESVVNTRFNLLRDVIAARKSNARPEQLLAISNSGEVVMTQVRTTVILMEQEENRLLSQRKQHLARTARNAHLTVLVASGLDLFLVLLIFRYLAREQKLRRISDANQRRLEKLQLINDVTLTRLSAKDLTQELLKRVCMVIPADAAILCIWYGDEIELTAVHGIEMDTGKRHAISRQGPIYRSISSNQIVILSSDDHLTLPIRGFREQMQSVQIAPLSIAESAFGVVITGRKSGERFSERDTQLVAYVADRIAISLDRANTYEAELRARKLSEQHAEEVRKLNSELEDRVRQRTSDLEATNRELEAFSYSVSHDLRAPLRTIDGFSLALEEDYEDKLESTGKDYIRRIRTGVQRMGMLIDTLLQLSRITRAELVHENLDLSGLAQEIASDLLQQTSDRTIHFEIEPGLSAIGDSRLIRVALENLLGNAVKFTANVPIAEIQFGRDRDTGNFFVKDNGAGFDMQYADKLFTAFQRLHGDREFLGYGIGLATVARVIHRHHGRVSAKGEVGRGATFTFSLGETP